jgi:predicted enzyme related to lactoylglutathione lyase
MRLACAMIYVKDMPRMKEFYGQLLGAQTVSNESSDSWALFETDGASVALHAIGEHAADISQARESNPVKLIFAVEDVVAERGRLEAMGVTMLSRPWQQPNEACDGIDPEGNIFQISRRWL